MDYDLNIVVGLIADGTSACGDLGDLGPPDVHVNAVCPGRGKAGPADDTMAHLARRDGIGVESACACSTMPIPLRRVARPNEIAFVCALLDSSEAAIVVDGAGCAASLAKIAPDV